MEPPSELNFVDTGAYRPQSEAAQRTRLRSTGPNETGGTALPSGALTKLVWEAGSQQMRDAFSWYANIDWFRPYFDVEPRQVRNRLILSLVPRKPSSIVPAYDLYGPLMLIFTLVALLQFDMKSSGYVVEDGTLIGSALITCFGYWLGCSFAIYALAYMFAAEVSVIMVTSLLGYALVGHCAIVALNAVVHPEHTHLFFYATVLIFAAPSAIRMAVILAAKTPQRQHKLTVLCAVIFLHICFILYLHFGYHKVVAELDTILGHQQLENFPALSDEK